jgi:hypothetical protein
MIAKQTGRRGFRAALEGNSAFSICFAPLAPLRLGAQLFDGFGASTTPMPATKGFLFPQLFKLYHGDPA